MAAVAGAFNNNGAGVRGDMKAVLKAVLLNRKRACHLGPQRQDPRAGAAPVGLAARLRLRLRFGRYRVGNTDNAGSSLGQTAMRSPSVFNFYRPGYVAPGTQAAAAGLVAPEMARWRRRPRRLATSTTCATASPPASARAPR